MEARSGATRFGPLTPDQMEEVEALQRPADGLTSSTGGLGGSAELGGREKQTTGPGIDA